MVSTACVKRWSACVGLGHEFRATELAQKAAARGGGGSGDFGAGGAISTGAWHVGLARGAGLFRASVSVADFGLGAGGEHGRELAGRGVVRRSRGETREKRSGRDRPR